MSEERLYVIPDMPEFQHLDQYESRRLQELMVAIDKAHHGTGKLQGTEGDELVALTREYRTEAGERITFQASKHLQKFSLDLAKVKLTDEFGFYSLVDTLRRKLKLTPLIFPHERESLMELYRAVDVNVVGDGLDANELDRLSTGVIKIGEYLRAKMDGLDDNPHVNEEEWLEYFGKERGDPEWLLRINKFRAKLDLDPLEESFTNCFVVIGDDVEPLPGAYWRQAGRPPLDGTQLYICFNHTFGKEPICDIQLVEGGQDEHPPPPNYEPVDGNLGTRSQPKYLCIKRGLPAISQVEVCYGPTNVDGYHTLQVDPHGIDGEVKLRWLLDGEDVPVELTEAQIQQRELARQMEMRKELSQSREGELHRLYSAIETAQDENEVLQMRIATFLHSPPSGSGEEDKNPSEAQRRFAKLVQQWCSAKLELENMRVSYNTAAMDLQTRLDAQETKANEIKESFEDFKREITRAAENSRTGKKIPNKVIAQFEADERSKNDEVERMRITDIKLRMQLRKISKALKQKEELQEGVHMIDFEQLKIENQTLNEKIEERNEELEKFRKKATTTVQVLTHIKEKSHAVVSTNSALQEELNTVDAGVSREREKLTKCKALRERLKAEEDTLKGQRGFVNNHMLVTDFESRKRYIDNLRDQIEELKEQLQRVGVGVGVGQKASRGK